MPSPLSALSLLCLLQAALRAQAFPQPHIIEDVGYDSAIAQGLVDRKSGHIAKAVGHFQEAARLASGDHDAKRQANALLLASGSQIRSFQYREALESADTSRQLALGVKDDTLAGAAANNKATIYSQLGDYILAVDAARESVSSLRRSTRKDYLAKAILNLGDIEAELGQTQASVSAFGGAVAAAHAAGFRDAEALAQDHLGFSLLEAGDLTGAGQSLNEAWRLRTELHDGDGLSFTTLHLAKLAYKRKNYALALRLIDQALTSKGSRFSSLPPYWSVQLRGQILLALGRRSPALTNFRQAVTLANRWRRYALPGDATSTSTVVELHLIYQDYIGLAADTSVQQHDPALARDAFEVLAENRASSLREEMLSSLGHDMQLPPRYFELLASLEDTQALVTFGRVPGQSVRNRAKLQRIHSELADLENTIGINQGAVRDEANSSRNSLRRIQRSLRSGELLLSFSLGQQKSFLWAITQDRLSLYELPSAEQIASHARAFSQAVQRGSSHSEGLTLSRDLFRQLDSSLAKRAEWLVAADGALLDGVPFSCLPDVSQAPLDVPLMANHNIRFLPSELLVASPMSPEPAPRFVGVADPIYNLADGRLYNLADGRRTRPSDLVPVHDAEPSVTLARLAGTDQEVRSAAASSGLNETSILTGALASGQGLRSALHPPPRMLHFAVHFVSTESRNRAGAGEAALALSLTSAHMPELLTKEAIAELRVPGTLVVLSGCASQQGENLPSAGLSGLSRAWLLAGASAVVVSAWPTPDDSGQFFSVFYTHLKAARPQSGNLAKRAAAALQDSQLDMRRSAGYRNLPSFWAAYSVISKE